MKITIEATPKEVKDLIQGIASNNEENTTQEEKDITDVLRGIDGGFVIGGIEYDPATGEGALKKMESKEKVEITVNSQVDTFEKSKELLADLEVLNEKYDILATVTVNKEVDCDITIAQKF